MVDIPAKLAKRGDLMQGYNVILLYSLDGEEILMCVRKKEPYLGLSNMVGGKIEPGESGEDAAYRELFEETSITKNYVSLLHLMDFTYYAQDCFVEVWTGRLTHKVSVQGDENDLYWSSLDRNFFDMTQFAGEGNIGHILEIANQSREEINRMAGKNTEMETKNG